MAKAQQGRPDPGDVVLFPFFWSRFNWRSHASIVARPCVVLNSAPVGGDEIEVVLVPITHTRQQSDAIGIEVPREMRLLMGLDERANYVVINEANSLLWPSETKVLLGRVPRSLHKELAFGVAELQLSRRLNHTEIRQQVDAVRRHARRR